MRTPLGEALAHDRELDAELAHEEAVMETCRNKHLPNGECSCGYHHVEDGED